MSRLEFRADCSLFLRSTREMHTAAAFDYEANAARHVQVH